MRTTWAFLLLLILISAVALAASRQSSHSRRPVEIAANYWTELLGGMNRMHLAVTSLAPSGSVDTDFVKLMLPHHQAAIDMAKTELLHGTNLQVRRLAQEILTEQQSEIELMHLWLKQAQPNEPNPQLRK